MEISINQKPAVVPEPCSVEQLLVSLSLHQAKGIAVAINQSVLPRAQWPSRQLEPNDQLTVIRATQGG